jgi:hypothetical protein
MEEPRRRLGKAWRKWTAGELAELRRLLAEGLRPEEIAPALGRTAGAVYQKAWAQGLACPTPLERRSGGREKAGPGRRRAGLRGTPAANLRRWA